MTNPKIKWSDPVTGLDGVIKVAKAFKGVKQVQRWNGRGDGNC